MTPATVYLDDAPSMFDLFTGESTGGELEPDEIVIDCFAGGGGASTGIEWATGRSPDEAINHSRAALAIHAANHPNTRHHQSDVWEVDPHDVARGRRVGLFWFSADCRHFSRSKGGVPLSRRIRALAHIAVRYAVKVRPRVIVGENVQEFVTWGPLSRATGRPDPRRRGKSFRAFVRQLEREGYVVQWRLLRGCDFGAPTTRLRLFLIARCDGRPIRWPTPTHGRRDPRTWAANIIDWSVPAHSIFLTAAEGKAAGVKRPLASKTMERFGRGVVRYVLDTPDPFLVELPAVDGSRRRLAAAFIAKHYGGVVGSSMRDPVHTITGTDHNALVLVPLGEGPRMERAAAFIAPYYGNERDGSSLKAPLRTVTGTDRFALVVAHGAPGPIADISTRMLTARELARGQGFPESYRLAVPIEVTDRRGRSRIRLTTDREQKLMIGNSVNPHVAAAIVTANLGTRQPAQVAA